MKHKLTSLCLCTQTQGVYLESGMLQFEHYLLRSEI